MTHTRVARVRGKWLDADSSKRLVYHASHGYVHCHYAHIMHWSAHDLEDTVLTTLAIAPTLATIDNIAAANVDQVVGQGDDLLHEQQACNR